MKEPKHYNSSFSRIFETHAHLYDEDDNTYDTEEMLRRAAKVGVKSILVPGSSIRSSALATEFASLYNSKEGINIYASVGVHPHDASSYDDNSEQILREYLLNREHNRVVALGEIGLDYHYDYSPRDRQRSAFISQLKLAYQFDIPVIFHEREATKDFVDIIYEASRGGFLRANPGVIHCCGMSPEIATEMVKLGFYIGFDGPITFKNNKNGAMLLNVVPEDRIVIETDSPYLTPEPNRGLQNEPSYLPYVIEKIAMILDKSPSYIAEKTYENALNLYEISE